jgi:hypothetical protein
LITRNTSAVAVCCSSASSYSVIIRAFSMAMTACSAKFCSNAICLSVKARTLPSADCKSAQGSGVLHRSHENDCPNAGNVDCGSGEGVARVVELFRGKIDDLEDALTLRKPPLKRVDLSSFA